jgi:hypothetical protein
MSSASHDDLNASKPALDSPLLAHDTLGRSSSHEGNESQTKETEPESAIPALKGSLKSRNSSGALHFNSPLKLAKALLLPVIAVAYMAFCFVVNERVVTVGNKNDSFQHISKGIRTSSTVTIAESCIRFSQSCHHIRDNFDHLVGADTFEIAHTRFKGSA